MHVPRIRQAAMLAPAEFQPAGIGRRGDRLARPSGHWRIALLVSVGMWVGVLSLASVVVGR